MDQKEAQKTPQCGKSNFFLIDALKEICYNNVDYFKEDESTQGLRLHGAFVGIIDHLDTAKPLVSEIEEFAGEYDFDEVTKGNGYRSFLLVFDSAVQHTLKLSKYVTENRSSILFRKNIYMK
jgi:hormone-sensitive lipase